MITFTRIHPHLIDIYFNGKHLGQLYVEVDGFWVVDFTKRTGFFSEEFLRAIVDKLTELNKDWKQTVSQIPPL